MCNGGGACGYVPNNILEVTKVVDVSGRGEPIYSHTIQVRGRRVAQHAACWSLPPPPLVTRCVVLSLDTKADDAKEGV